MDTIISVLESPARQVRAYAERVAKDIPVNSFSRKPNIAGKVIDCVHPAFVFGHLSLYPARIFKFLSLDSSQVMPSQRYYDLFAAGAACLDDEKGEIYPSAAEILNAFFSGTDYLLSQIKNFTDDLMLTPNDEERTRERYPMKGSFVAYLLTAHPNGHLGQISTWRRCVGLGPA